SDSHPTPISSRRAGTRASHASLHLATAAARARGTDRRRSKSGGQERHQVPEGGLDIAGIAESVRDGFDALRAAGGVINRPEHEVEPPQDLADGQLRQAL